MLRFQFALVLFLLFFQRTWCIVVTPQKLTIPNSVLIRGNLTVKGSINAQIVSELSNSVSFVSDDAELANTKLRLFNLNSYRLLETGASQGTLRVGIIADRRPTALPNVRIAKGYDFNDYDFKTNSFLGDYAHGINLGNWNIACSSPSGHSAFFNENGCQVYHWSTQNWITVSGTSPSPWTRDPGIACGYISSDTTIGTFLHYGGDVSGTYYGNFHRLDVSSSGVWSQLTGSSYTDAFSIAGLWNSHFFAIAPLDGTAQATTEFRYFAFPSGGWQDGTITGDTFGARFAGGYAQKENSVYYYGGDNSGLKNDLYKFTMRTGPVEVHCQLVSVTGGTPPASYYSSAVVSDDMFIVYNYSNDNFFFFYI